MTKISQLSDIGANLAANDEFVVRDVSDASTPNKKVTASGIIDYVINQGSVAGFSQITAGSPVQSRVLCTSSGTDSTIVFTTNTVEAARITDDGRFLVGTSSAVTAASKNSYFQIVGAGQESSSLQVTRLSSSNEAPSFILGKANGSTVTSIVSSGTQLGRIEFAGSDGNNLNPIGARIDAFADATVASGSLPTRLVFATTASGSSSPTERGRVDSLGRWAFGTTSTTSAQRFIVVGNSYGGGTGTGVAGSTLPQGYFGGAALDNSGSVDPLGYVFDGGGGNAPRGHVVTFIGNNYNLTGAQSCQVYVKNTQNGGLPYGGSYTSGVLSAYAGPTVSGIGGPLPASGTVTSYGLNGAPLISAVNAASQGDGVTKVGFSAELKGNYGGGSPGAWGGYCYTARIATNFGSGSTGSNFGYLADISGAGAGASANWAFYAVAGDAAKPGGGSWQATSDARVKNVKEQYLRGLDEVMMLNPVRYEYNGKGETKVDGKIYTGLIAQEVQEIIPEIISKDPRKLNPEDEEKTSILMLNPSDLVYVLINACKELKAEIDQLRATVSGLSEN